MHRWGDLVAGTQGVSVQATHGVTTPPLVMRKPRYRQVKYPQQAVELELGLGLEAPDTPQGVGEQESGQGRQQPSRSCLSWKPRAEGAAGALGPDRHQFRLGLSHSRAVLDRSASSPGGVCGVPPPRGLCEV